MTVIFSTHPLHPAVTDDLRALGEVRIASSPTLEAILAESNGAEMIVVRAPIPPAIIRREPLLRACLRHGAGLDMIPVDVATEMGVLVTNVPGANAVTVAEHAVWSAMALLRRYPQVSSDLHSAGWEAARQHADAGRELSGRTLGLLGAGNIGRNVARIAAGGFGMRVIATTRTPASLPEGIEAVAFEGLMAQSDILVLCCPLDDATRGIIDADALALMRRDAILINVSRGPVVVQPALIDALQRGRLAGAALDVFDSQPLPMGHPLLALPNVILTPHMAGITEESMLRMGRGVVESSRAILAGDLPHALVNPDAVSAYRKRFP